MSNDKASSLSIKEYAQLKGKTVQAVYQQMKRKENAAALEGHVFFRRIGNKDVKYLDEIAMEILDNSSYSTTTIIEKEDLKDELVAVTEDRDRLQKQLIFQEGRISALQDQLEEKERQLRALAAPQERIEALEAQKASLSADKEYFKTKLAQDEEMHQKALKRVSDDLEIERKVAIDAIKERTEAEEYARGWEEWTSLPWLKRIRTPKPVREHKE